MAYDYTWWQSLLQIMIYCFFIGGFSGLLSALFYWFRGRPYRPNRHPGKVAILSLIALALGTVSFLLTRDLLLPRQVAI